MNCYVISDLHFGHANVIKYEPIRAEKLANYIGSILDYDCKPNEVLDVMNLKPTKGVAYSINNEGEDPFVNAKDYFLRLHNDMLIEIWNNTIEKDDIVYFLGDLAITNNKDKLKNWIKRLNGRKVLIMGNHDTRKPSFYVECGFEWVSKCPILFNKHIWLSHEPMPHELVPEGYINFFGHVHGNTIFNWERGICVSIEQLKDFKPLNIKSYIGDFKSIDENRHEEAGVVAGQISFDDLQEQEYEDTMNEWFAEQFDEEGNHIG